MAEIGGSRFHRGPGLASSMAVKWNCPTCHTENLGPLTNGCVNERCPSRVVPEKKPPVTGGTATPSALAVEPRGKLAKEPLIVSDVNVLRTIASALVVYSENVLAANKVDGEMSPEAATEFGRSILRDCVGETDDDVVDVVQTKYHLVGRAEGVSVDKWFDMDEQDVAAREQARLQTVFPDGVFSVEIEIPEEKES